MSDFFIKITLANSSTNSNEEIELSSIYKFSEDFQYRNYSLKNFLVTFSNKKSTNNIEIFENADFIVLTNISRKSPERKIKDSKRNDLKETNLAKDILNHFLKKNTQFLNEIKNPFSLIIFNKNKKEVFLARDHMGLKNIFFYKDSNNLFISSRLSLLSKHPDIPKKINENRVADFLEMKISKNSYTFYQNIFKVPPSSFTKIRKNKIYSFVKYNSNNKIKLNKDNLLETSHNLKNYLISAMQRDKLENPAKVGFLFSGGLDSSSVISLYKENKSENQKIFALTSDYEKLEKNLKKNISEIGFQKEITKSSEISQIKFNGISRSTLDDVDLFLDVIGEPFFFPNLYVPYNCFLEARKEGIYSVFNGNDGDTVISHGYEFLTELFISLRWLRLKKEISSLAKRINKSQKFVFKRLILSRAFYSYKNFIINFLKLDKYFYNPILAKSTFLKSSNFYKNNKVNAPKIRARSFHKAVMNQSLAFDAIEKQGVIAAYLGIQEQYPFYDRDVVNYCLSIKPSYKLKNGLQRFILREAVKGTMPEKNRLRTDKSDLSAALIWSFRNKNKEFIENSIKHPHYFLQSKIDQKKLKNAWKKVNQNEKLSGSSVELGIIFTYAVLNHWLKKQFDISIEPIENV